MLRLKSMIHLTWKIKPLTITIAENLPFYQSCLLKINCSWF